MFREQRKSQKYSPYKLVRLCQEGDFGDVLCPAFPASHVQHAFRICILNSH